MISLDRCGCNFKFTYPSTLVMSYSYKRFLDLCFHAINFSNVLLKNGINVIYFLSVVAEVAKFVLMTFNTYDISTSSFFESILWLTA